MAACAMRLRIDVGTPEPVDELCQDCHLPALVRADVLWVHADGVTPIGTITACTTDGCDIAPSP
ncbi:hypothetical protein [Nocardiopsis sp. YSL2]|uniref:hypothetical protein n=1 Tax=Nocardiopsis sp. YSL2 TaxID=2939492 RepID=UPI0026F4558F|nr:hypothetical protein [Nocardiopsis sp. YSL2]